MRSLWALGRGAPRRWQKTAVIGAVSVSLGLTLAIPTAGAASGAGTGGSRVTSTVQKAGLTLHAKVDLRTIAANDARRSLASPAGTSTGRARVVPLKAPPAARSGKATLRPQTATKASLTPISGNLTGFSGFDGITAAINGSENSPETGGVGDVAPPDQGLAVGPSAAGTAVFEAVNDTIAVYRTNGQDLATVPAYQFFGLPASAFLSDPRVYYDGQTGHWFVTMFTVGNPSGSVPSEQYIAVSQTTDPLGAYTVFSIDTSDTGTSGCPCFGDYDQVGANATGFYISTNEFGISSGAFNGTIIYAVSKQALISAARGFRSEPPVETVRVPYASDPFAAYHLAPSEEPPGGTNPEAEYFVESNANQNYGSALEVFSLLGTNKLATGGPLTLVKTKVASLAYQTPPNAYQESGPNPLGQSGGLYNQPGFPGGEPSFGVAPIQTDFDAVQEVTFAGGNLYAELDSGFASPRGFDQAAADWFVVHPVTSGGKVTASMVKQGSVQTSQSLLYPDLAVNTNGYGYLAFAVSGTTMYPSAGYMKFEGANGAVEAAGVDPLDDFTCYYPFGPACRYGDYSGGQAYGGRLYMATEYIAPQARDTLANWATRVYSGPTP
jgi:hypothetical protein